MFPSPEHPYRVIDPSFATSPVPKSQPPTRSAPGSPPRLGFHLAATVQRLEPVAGTSLFVQCLPSNCHSPSGLLTPPDPRLLLRAACLAAIPSLRPIQATDPIPGTGVHRNRPPDLSSLPDYAIVSCASGSSFRVRYVPSGSLFRLPLGTIVMMRRNALAVNGKKRSWQRNVICP